jgi:proline iminopeptidase
MDRARAEKNATAVRELQSIAPYAEGDKPIPRRDLLLQRKWVGIYGGVIRRPHEQ